MTSPRYAFPDDTLARLVARDGSLFSDDPVIAAEAAEFMGWTRLAHDARDVLPQVHALAEEVLAEGVTDVVLLGMGGSSLASLVIGEVLGTGTPRLHVLDTTSPITVFDTAENIDPATAIFLVSSKSGGTVEPNALYAVFRARADELLGVEEAGRRFIAITDPGSSLEALAEAQGFRATVLAPPNVGGRYSALTVFGLVPAALMGVDLDRLLEPAEALEREYAVGRADLALGEFIAAAHAQGADKLTLVLSRPWMSFGLWVEQLTAESLGKQGTGVVPVIEYGIGGAGYGVDRAIVALGRSVPELGDSFPYLEIPAEDPYDLGRLFVMWEYAVALAGIVLGINPFDQPNVAEAKDATGRVLAGATQAPAATFTADGMEFTWAGGLEASHTESGPVSALHTAFDSLSGGDYLALLAYLPHDDEVMRPLLDAVPLLARHTGCAVTPATGPRYLHSTGQLHKGGPNSGVFILVTTRDEVDVDVPGFGWSLGALHAAQADGDLLTLAAHDRRVLRVSLPDASRESTAALAAALIEAARR